MEARITSYSCKRQDTKFIMRPVATGDSQPAKISPQIADTSSFSLSRGSTVDSATDSSSPASSLSLTDFGPPPARTGPNFTLPTRIILTQPLRGNAAAQSGSVQHPRSSQSIRGNQSVNQRSPRSIVSTRSKSGSTKARSAGSGSPSAVVSPVKRIIIKTTRKDISEDETLESSMLTASQSSGESSLTVISTLSDLSDVRKEGSKTLQPELLLQSCALCQLNESSRFGQGQMLSFPAAIDLPPPLEMHNGLREKQQYDDLHGIGHEQRKPVQNIFNKDAAVPAHENCLRWSTNAVPDTSGVCTNVIPVVASALFEACSACGRFGASVRCSYPHCTNIYHLPCAASGDCHLRHANCTILCPSHLSALGQDVKLTVEDLCAVCGSISADEVSNGTVKDLFCCFTCGRHAHTGCIGGGGWETGTNRKAGWQCQECKSCTVCKSTEKSDKVVCCCDCGRDYHLSCLSPPMGGLPKLLWKCPRCRICSHCTKRTAGGGPSCKWHQNYTLCDSCYQQKTKGSVCTICQKAYRFTEQRDMLKCASCSGYTHKVCDPVGQHGLYECSRCVTQQKNEDQGLLGAGDTQLTGLLANMNHSSSPSSSSIFSSSLDDSSVTEQGSEVSVGGGKPIARIKRRLPTQSASGRTGRKRQRTATPTCTLQPSGRKKGKGKSLLLRVPSGKIAPTTNGVPDDGDQGNEDDDSVHTSTVVVFRTTDEILQVQDICVSCGSIGVAEEGKMIGCAQCGQCYHHYCARVNLNSVVLTKGWRCLDCTVCEGCGKPHDEARLILCDECDISFHIYCLEPPLDQVPTGTWKCKRCVVCQFCGSTSPGHGASTWQNNYSTCTPCASLQKCPFCEKDYIEQERIIQCLQCDRWLHAACDAIMDDDDVEAAISIGYVCPFCRPENHPPLHLQHVFVDEDDLDGPGELPAEKKPLVPHKFDGMMLSDSGLKHIKQLSVEHAKPKLSKKKPTKVSESASQQSSTGNGGREEDISMSQELGNLMDEASLDDSRKKPRVRKPQRFGVGGFLPRGPKPKAERDREKDDVLQSQMDVSLESHPASGTLSPESVDTHLTEFTGLDAARPPTATSSKWKKKKPVPKRRNAMKDAYPDYLQDAFFGREALDDSADQNQETGSESLSLLVNIEQPPEARKPVSKTPHGGRQSIDSKADIKLETAPSSSKASTSKESAPVNPVDISMSEDDDDFTAFGDGDGTLEFLAHDMQEDELLGMFLEAANEPDDDAPLPEEESVPSVSRPAKETDPDIGGDNLFAPFIDSLEHTDLLPQITSEDAEDIFNDVFMGESSTAGALLSRSYSQSDVPPVVASVNVHPPPLRTSLSMPGISLPLSEQFASGNWAGHPAQSLLDETADNMEPSTVQKTMAKWEQDEHLGEMATVTAVLYTNMKHPDLIQKYPEWSDRYKQMLKLWRKISSDDRKPYLIRARENRATTKANKAQRLKEEKVDKSIVGTVAMPDRPASVYNHSNSYPGPAQRSFSTQESLESFYGSSSQEEFSVQNPSTPMSQPSTPGSSASLAHLQSYHVGSPGPPFSPPLDRPRSVLPNQHSVTEQQRHGVQSPHSYQQVQSPRTPYPPSSPFDPYAHAPASVPPSFNRQLSHDFSQDDQDPYLQQPGTPMPGGPQRFPHSYPNVQSPQGAPYFPRQQLRDLLARQQGQRQRQGPPVGNWPQYQPQPTGPGNFPSPSQVDQQQHYPRGPGGPGNYPPRQEFRQPQPPQPRMMQQIPRNFSPQQQMQRHQMAPRVPNHVMQQRPVQPGGPYPMSGGDPQQGTYPVTQQWQSQPTLTLSDQQQHQPHFSGSQQFQPENYGHSDHHLQNRPEFNVDGMYNYRGPAPLQQQPQQQLHFAPHGPQSPGVTRQAAPWAALPQQFSPPQPPRSQSVAPQKMQSPPPPSPAPPLQNGMMQSQSTVSVADEAERQAGMTQKDFLVQNHVQLSTDQTKLEDQIAKVRKVRKSLAARQRQLKKNGGDLSPEELVELERLTQQVAAIQKDLEHVRKANKQHNTMITEYETKFGVQLIARPPPALMAPVPGGQTVRATGPQQPVQSVSVASPSSQMRPSGMSPSFPNRMMSPIREEQFSPHHVAHTFGDQPTMNDHVMSSPPRLQPAPPPRFPPSQPYANSPMLPQVIPLQQLTSQSFPPEVKIEPLSPHQTHQGHPALRPPGTDIHNGGDLRSPATVPTNHTAKRDSHASASGDTPEEKISVEKKNVLLKQLLESPSDRIMTVSPQKSQQDEDDEDNITALSLTPAQREQLALIDSMPLEVQKENNSSSPSQSLAGPSELMHPPVSETSGEPEAGKKKKRPSKKKKKQAVADGDATSDPPNRALVDALMERLGTIPHTLYEPEKCALPTKSIVIKAEGDASPVPVGKQLEDSKKPLKRPFVGGFGQYDVAKLGPKSRYYVCIEGQFDEIFPLFDDTSSWNIYEECGRHKIFDLPASESNDIDIKMELDDDYRAVSPSLSFVSTSSQGECRLLSPCYDNSYDWLDIAYQPQELPLAEMETLVPILPPMAEPVYSPVQSTTSSSKENCLEEVQSLSNIAKVENSVAIIKPNRHLHESDRVNCSLIITEEAARDLNGFLKGLASLLEVSPGDIVMTGCEAVEHPHLSNNSAIANSHKYCCTCDVAMTGNGVIRKKLSEFAFPGVYDNGLPVEMEDETAYLFFCGQQCLMQFALNYTNGSKPSPPATVSVDHGVAEPSKPEPKKERRESVPKRQTSVQMILKSIAPLLRKGKKAKQDMWTPALLLVKASTAAEPLTPEQVLDRLDVGIRRDPTTTDVRVCVLCHLIGDYLTSDGPGRLLNIDGDHWVHLNCALWSTEVYETNNGHLMNVLEACKRGTRTECVKCRKTGATMRCINSYKLSKIRCNQLFHFPCARMSNCMFFTDKSIFCDAHKPKEPPEDELKSLSVMRKVFINRDEYRLVSTLVLNPDGMHTFRIGTLIFQTIGQISLSNIQNFHTETCIYPIGYSVTRIFWSMRVLNHRCYYHCSIHESGDRPEFRINVREVGHPDLLLMDSSAKGVWMKVLTAVLNLRSTTMIKIFPDFFNGDDLFGLTEANISQAIESLPGVSAATNYSMKFEKSRPPELALLSRNASGSARTEPSGKNLFSKSENASHHAAHRRHTTVAVNGHFSTSSLLPQLTGGASSCSYDSNSTYQKQQLTHSKINQYRKMKVEWKRNVYLARSKIEGLGLFASCDLEKGTMIIEYVGELIRNEVANNRERVYDIMNRAGIYMFRLDHDEVCDASRAGGPARFINHSCDPNCITEVVQTDKDDKKIVISSIRRIQKGEELCYDYKFDFEDDQHKIPCNCNARNCQLWMN